MLLTIITVAYNSDSTIESTLQSIDLFINQHEEQIEHLIIDGGSSDQTLQVVDRYKKPYRIVYSSPDKGIYDAMNKGASNSLGEYLWFINSDDIVHQDLITYRTDFLELLDSRIYDIFLGSIDMFNNSTMEVTRRWGPSRYKLSTAINLGWTPSHPGSIIRKQLFDRLDGFNLTYELAADVDLLLRAIGSVHHSKIRLVNYKMILFRLGGASNGSIKKILKNNVEFYQIRRASGYGIIRSLLFTLLKVFRKLIQ